jgi:hypothetical protein
MSRLNPIEQECQDVLVVLLDLMSAGHQKLEAKVHMELTGRVRTAVQHLINKEYGCKSGKHAGPCTCKEGVDGHTIQYRI